MAASESSQRGGGPGATTAGARRSRPILALWAVAIALLAFNLRIAVNALGVVLPELRQDTDLSATSAGVLLALPTVCFSVFGFSAPAFARRMGIHRALILSLSAMVAGQIARAAVPGATALFAGSVVALGGIAVANILLPSLVRLHFPASILSLTALYTSALMAGLALAAGVTLPVQRAMSGTWRWGIGMWSIAAGSALLLWAALAVRDRRGWRLQSSVGLAGRNSAAIEPPRVWSMSALLRSPRAWSMAGFFGLQSLQAYVLFGWMVSILVDGGLRDSTAALNLAVLTAIGAPIAAVTPRIMGTPTRQRWLLVLATLTLVVGLIGLTFFPTRMTWLHIVAVGIGSGALLPIALTLIAVRSRSAEGTAALSGFSQSIGYLVASLGPFAFGVLHDLTHAWLAPMTALVVLLGLMLVCGLGAIRPWYIEQDFGREATSPPRDGPP